jgi:hypothetical protein
LLFCTISQQNKCFESHGHCVIVLVFFQAKPSQAVVAAKRNAKMRQVSKKVPDVVIKDIYQTVR